MLSSGDGRRPTVLAVAGRGRGRPDGSPRPPPISTPMTAAHCRARRIRTRFAAGFTRTPVRVLVSRVRPEGPYAVTMTKHRRNTNGGTLVPDPVLTPAAVRSAAEKMPRVRLAHLPTPLEEVPRFAAKLGGGVRVFIKRDDCTGLVLGGNKARHNEFLLADALSTGCDILVWGALVQSNNCRQTAAGCARLGLECRLYLSKGHYKTEPQGNLLLDYLVGARVEFTDATIGPELNALLAAKAEEFRRVGRKPYFWDPPRVVPLAAVSYVLCMAEIAEQSAALE